MSVIKHSTMGSYLPVEMFLKSSLCIVTLLGCMPDISEPQKLVEESILLGATEAPSCGTEHSVPKAVKVRYSL